MAGNTHLHLPLQGTWDAPSCKPPSAPDPGPGPFYLLPHPELAFPSPDISVSTFYLVEALTSQHLILHTLRRALSEHGVHARC